MKNVIVIQTEEDLYELTGLEDGNALWDAGFILDDWEWGICLDEPIHTERIEKEHRESIKWYGNDHCWHDEPECDVDVTIVEEKANLLSWQHMLYDSWQNERTLGTHAEYKGKHYYLWHHS